MANKFAFLAVLALSLASSVGNAAVTFDQDTVIDAGNSFPNDHVRIIDGPSLLTHVTMEPAGAVAGFTVTGNSVFEMKGGSSTFLSDLEDNAILIMRGGTIDCSEAECLLIDYVSVLSASGNSTGHMYGGSFPGGIRLEDESTWHFYGRGLSLTAFASSALVEGELANGQPASYLLFSLTTPLDPLSRIFIHEVPEPGSLIMSLVLVLGIQLGRYGEQKGT